MEFEFNEHKSRANKAKHGIDFVDAQLLWSDDRLVEIRARTEDETRSRPEEIALYESQEP